MSSNIGTSIGGAFINWFSEDVMPKFATAVDLTVLLISIILNVLLIVMFNKKHLFLDPANRLVFQLIIVDILAWLFILIPGAVVALRGQWDLPMSVCYAQVVMVNSIYLVMFGLITTLFIERTVLVRNPKLHEKVFGKVSHVNIISFLIWGIDFGIASVPTSGWSRIDYDFYHGSCTVYHESNVYYAIILFMFGMGLSILSGVVCVPIILKSRKERIVFENAEAAKIEAELRRKKRMETIAEEKKEAEKNKDDKDLEKKSLTPHAKQGWTDTKQPDQHKDNKTRNRKGKKRARRARTPKRRDKRLLEDDYDDPDFHLTVTYLIMWVLILILWLPYFIVVFRHAISNDLEFWRGYYSITIIIALFSFCIKPIIYLSHNRHMQEKTKNTIPDNVVNRATALRMSFSDVVDKLDKIVFKSPRPQPSIQTTVKAHSIAMNWMKKSNVKGEEAKPEVRGTGDNGKDTNKFDKSQNPGNEIAKNETDISKSISPNPSEEAGILPKVTTSTSPGPLETSTAIGARESTLIDIEGTEQVTDRWPLTRSPEHISRM
ncbi:uncharacterized protein LOC117329989 [Pecten maximus]|uniref:uncharacterized protein LOC117329989 n=1 Tax=Pecten maximus TaxID=6579 RepID=UPI0014582167|nr:uncharacterized protein LOC117329989 [Pecten maximus]